MRHRWTRPLGAASLALVLSLGLMAGPVIFPVDQVKPGQTGKGRTVFRGTTIEEFDVEVLGVLPGAFPKKSVILARLKGQGLENSGIIQGMSGSPVYIDGKLLGAVAFSFPFSKEPIAGITPIQDMLDTSAESGAPPSAFAPGASVVRKLTLEDFLALNKDLFVPRRSLVAEGRTLAPLPVPLLFSGFSQDVLEKSRPFLTRLGLVPVLSSSVQSGQETLSPASISLKEGDAVAVQLVSGDLDLSTVGTVTHVDGNKVYAFGHQLYNLGTVEYAMAKASVLAVIPSLESSFKMAVPEFLIGRFSQDRSSGVYGEMGKMPRVIPVNVRIQDAAQKTREYKLKVINDRILGPYFASLALGNILSAGERAVGDLTLALKGDVYLDDGKNVHIEDLFSGNFDAPVNDLASLVLTVVYFLINNEFAELGIHRLDLNIQADEQVKFCYLEKALLDAFEVGPEDVMRLRLHLRTFRGEPVVEEIPLPVPPLPAGSEFEVLLGDAASMIQWETGVYRNVAFMPRNLTQLVRLLNNLRKNNRVYVKLVATKPGLFLKGEELPNLPSTMKSLFASPRAATSPIELRKSTLGEYQVPVDFVFKGAASLPVKIKK